MKALSFLFLFFLILGCTTLKETFVGEDRKPTPQPYFECEGKDYFYQISYADDKTLTLKLDPRFHEGPEKITFPRGKCTKKEKFLSKEVFK